jgi:hypothetical protein
MIEILNKLIKDGWYWTLRVEDDFSITFSICRPSWVTNNLGMSYALPFMKMKSLDEFVDRYKEWVGEKDENKNRI